MADVEDDVGFRLDTIDVELELFEHVGAEGVDMVVDSSGALFFEDALTSSKLAPASPT